MAIGSEVGRIFFSLDLDDSKFKQGLDSASKTSSGFGGEIQGIANKAALALGAVGAGLTIYAKRATDFTVEYVKNAKALARETGSTTEEASRLLFVTNRLGISADQVGQVFGIFAKKINAATNTTESNRLAMESLQNQIRKTQFSLNQTTDDIAKHGDRSGELTIKLDGLRTKLSQLQDQLNATTNPLDQLGISTKNADGTTKSFNAILLEVADKFKVMPDGATKTALALDLFGRSGKDMVKFLNLGSQGIADLEKQADKLGLTLTPGTVSKVAEFIKSQKDLKDQTDSLKLSVGLATTPVLTDFNKWLNSVIQSLLGMGGPMRTVTTDVLAFGGPILTGTAGLIGFLANLDQALPAITKMATAMRDLTVATALMSVSAIASAVATLIAFGPVILLGIAIGGLAVLIIKNWDAIQFAFFTARDFIISVFQAIKAWIDNAISWFQQLPGRIVGAIASIPGLVWGIIKQAVSAILGFYGDFYGAGWQLIKGLASGIAGAVGHVINAVKGVLSRVRNMLPFSDAKEGPLSDLTKSGRMFSQTFARGILTSANLIQSATNRALGLDLGGIGGGLAGAGSAYSTTNNNFPGNIVLQDASAVDRFFERLDRNQELESMGLSPQ